MTDVNTSDVPPPSAKAQGKRPANGDSSASIPVPKHESVTPAPSLSTSNAPSKAGVQTRQKRVLPTRSRRGGPGVGSCEVDVMILETRKRRLENEPLIPADTKFLFTTNSALVPPADDGASVQLRLNAQAYGRYFDRPEVQAACREQQLIQTPEFTLLPVDAIVGGRFRPRGSEEEMVDTSDAAYEKRHRKYETFEKRQRLREKEKLKHEQYKLNERIEQLRGMDTSAFLALPASMFSEPIGATDGGEHDEADLGLLDLPGAHVNGAAAHHEGERRRQEMLEVAETLAERYRVLLPPDRKWAEKKEAEKREKALRESAEASAEPEIEYIEKRIGRGHARAVSESSSVEDEDEREDEEEEDQLVSDKDEEIPPARPAQGRRNDSDGESEVDFEERERERSKGLKLRIKFPPGLVIRKRSEETPLSPSYRKKHSKYKNEDRASSSVVGTSPKGKVRAADSRFQPKSKRQTALDEYSVQPPTKKYKTNAPTPVGKHTTKVHSSQTKVECALLKAAERNTAAPSARKTQRHVTAFGAPVPEEISQIRDFMIPPWGWPRISQGEDSEIEIGDYRDGPSNGYALGSSADPEYEVHWAEEDEDTKEDFPEIATLEED